MLQYPMTSFTIEQQQLIEQGAVSSQRLRDWVRAALQVTKKKVIVKRGLINYSVFIYSIALVEEVSGVTF